VNLDTGTGSITAGFAAPPDDLQVGSGTGSVSIGLPGDVSYNVSVTGVQSSAVNVHQSASSPYRIRVSGGTGTISIVPGAPATSPASA